MAYDVNQIIKERNAANCPATVDEAPVPKRPGLLVPLFGLILALILISGAEAGLEKLKVFSLKRSDRPTLVTNQGFFNQAGRSIEHWSVSFRASTNQLKNSVDFYRRQINYNLLSTALALTDKTGMAGYRAIDTLTTSVETAGEAISDGSQFVLAPAVNIGKTISANFTGVWQSGYLALIRSTGQIQTTTQTFFHRLALAVSDSVGSVRQVTLAVSSDFLAVTGKVGGLWRGLVGPLVASVETAGEAISDGSQFVLSATINAGQKISATIVQTWQFGYLALTQTVEKIQTVGRSGSLAVADSVGQGQNLLAATGLSLAGRIGHGLSKIGDYLDIIFHNTSSYLAVIKDNWSYFLSGSRPAAANLSTADQDMLRQEIKREILAELGDDWRAILSEMDITEPTLVEGGDGRGVVVVPPGNGLTVEDVRRQVQTMFSDEIRVQFDQSGQAGVITPVFRRATGQDYIFVLTPVAGRQSDD
ncbi:MAG: hypothetical protein WDZ85_00410 [Candidatus Paceibacterota bacterium]